MGQRIAKLLGDAYSTNGDVHVRVVYNGNEVINGPVSTNLVDVIPTASDFADDRLTLNYNELGQFETTTSHTGNIPVVISVTGGTLFFSHFIMNYTGYTRVRQQTNPHIPMDLDNPSTYTWNVTTSPDSFYSDPNTDTIESDGVSNLKLNSQSWNYRSNVNQNNYGNWTYPIADGDTITFDFFVDPAKVKLIVPTH
jgi:hypothetical protein